MPFVNMTPHVLNVFTDWSGVSDEPRRQEPLAAGESQVARAYNGWSTSPMPREALTLYPAGGCSLRVAQTFEPVGVLDGVALYQARYGAVETVDNATKAVLGGLPPVVEGTTYVVSGQALEAVKGMGRSDFAAPGELVRNDAGQPVGCKGLKVN